MSRRLVWVACLDDEGDTALLGVGTLSQAKARLMRAFRAFCADGDAGCWERTTRDEVVLMNAYGDVHGYCRRVPQLPFVG